MAINGQHWCSWTVRMARRVALVGRLAIGWAAGIVLAGSVAVPASAVAAEPEQPTPACVDVQPDTAAAEAMVPVCRRRVEILSERTEVSQTYVNPDGSRILEQGIEPGIEPVRVRKGSSWVPVDTVLKATGDGLVPRATVLPMVFSSGGDSPLARIRDGDRELAMTWPEPLPPYRNCAGTPRPTGMSCPGWICG